MSVTTLATSIRYEYTADVTEYEIPYQYREWQDVKVQWIEKASKPKLWIFRKYNQLTEGTDYIIDADNRIMTILTSLPEGAIIEIYRATVPIQPTPFPSETLTQKYEDSIDRNTYCIQELHTWAHHLSHELRQLEHWTVWHYRKLVKWVNDKLDDFEARIKEVEEELENIHIADLPYVLQLAEYMTLLLRYAEEKLLTDLRYPISAYRERTRDKFGLDTAVLIVQRKQIIRVDDEGECDV